jgi:hypothetical chaperone protein
MWRVRAESVDKRGRLPCSPASLVGIGIDFGTSNSAVALATAAGDVRLAGFRRPIDAGRSETTPTVLFFPSYERAVHSGHAAVARYLLAGLEGRFVQSMKAFLPSRSFTGTVIRGRHMDIEDLVATFLTRLIEEAELELGLRIRDEDLAIVLGRPARFSEDEESDALAEERLVRAAKKAGIERFRLLIEPVAAALAYEAMLERDEIVLVADLGGGTSDFTLMQVGPTHRRRRDRRGSILASRGVPIAGDRFDGELVRLAILPSVGFGSDYLAFTDRAPVPHWIFHKLLQWNHVSFLKSRETLEFLRLVERTSSAPEGIGRLLRLVEEDQGYLLFRAVERAKRELGERELARIADEEHELAVDGEITRSGLEEGVAALAERILATARETLTAAGLRPEQIDAVFLTGGTSLLHPVRRRFLEVFGASRIRGGETFTSVASGLARSAHVEL